MTRSAFSRLAPLALAAACQLFGSGASATSAENLNNPRFEDPLLNPVNKCAGKHTGQLANNWDENSNCESTVYSVTYSRAGNRPADAGGQPTGLYSQQIALAGDRPDARFQSFVWLTAGQRYKATFWLKADANREVHVSLRRGGWPYTEYGVLTAKATTAWKKFEFEGFAPNDPSGQTAAWLHVHLAKAGTYQIDDASVVSDADTVGDPAVRTTAVPRKYFGLHVLRDVDTNGRPVGGFIERNNGFVRLWDSGASWLNVQPDNQNTYNWTGFDARVDQILRHNAEPVMVLGGLLPVWAVAQADRPRCYFYGDPVGAPQSNSSAPPADIETWKTWVRAVAEHNRGKIRHWEIWNEPYMCEAFNDRMPYLVQMTAEAARILKEVDPANVVLSPTMPPWGNEYVDRFLQDGGGPHIDALAVHLYDNYLGDNLNFAMPFQYGDASSVEDLLLRDRYMANLRLVLGRNGLGSLPVWNTESGYAVRNIVCSTNGLDRATPYIARHQLLSWIAGIERSTYYAWDLRFQPHGQSNTCFTAASLGREAVETDNLYNVTAAGTAYEQITKWMTGAVVSKPELVSNTSNSQKIWTVKLKRGPTTSIVAWNPSWAIGGPAGPTYTLPSPKLQRRTDLAGSVANVSGGVSAITNSPVLFTAPATAISMTSFYGGLRQGWNYTNTLTATVTGGATPAGYVQFKIDGINLGPQVALVNGVAKLQTQDIDDYAIGWHTLTATYLGDEYNPASTVPTGTQIRVCPYSLMLSCPQ